ncbi:NAD(+)/NADH kinase [Vallicoccus soli]|uniref:NAD kinase n=1 Tax=Vallicoccus soli TaxID=2339232 RepID=A0A3A3ZGL1_9ACTN|nr:NAD(+)/NADH kinase [Vallicoccus soli]
MLHPRRDSAEAVGAVLAWARGSGRCVLATPDEAQRLPEGVEVVGAEELAARSGLLVSLGGDGTMLRALRGAYGHGTPVLGVNLGKLGFLAEVDVPELADALAVVERGEHEVETRVAVRVRVGGTVRTAFNDVALVRHPGEGSAAVSVVVDDEPFVRYAADALVVATPTGSTAYGFSAGGPVVSPRAQGLVVVPAAAHSSFNRALFLSCSERLCLEVLDRSGPLAVEVDGNVAGRLGPGDRLPVEVDLHGGSVVRVGRRSFYARARRKLRVTDSAELG